MSSIYEWALRGLRLGNAAQITHDGAQTQPAFHPVWPAIAACALAVIAAQAGNSPLEIWGQAIPALPLACVPLLFVLLKPCAHRRDSYTLHFHLPRLHLWRSGWELLIKASKELIQEAQKKLKGLWKQVQGTNAQTVWESWIQPFEDGRTTFALPLPRRFSAAWTGGCFTKQTTIPGTYTSGNQKTGDTTNINAIQIRRGVDKKATFW